MSPFIWLSLWVVGLVASIAFHEWAHVHVAKRFGWTYNGIVFKPWIAAVGVKLETDDPARRGLWQIGAAGPIATFIAAFIALYMAGLPSEGLALIMPSLCAFNVAIGLINLIPSPITDGGHIVTGLTGWEMRWRYTIFLWLGAEFIFVWYYFLA